MGFWHWRASCAEEVSNKRHTSLVEVHVRSGRMWISRISWPYTHMAGLNTFFFGYCCYYYSVFSIVISTIHCITSFDITKSTFLLANWHSRLFHLLPKFSHWCIKGVEKKKETNRIGTRHLFQVNRIGTRHLFQVYYVLWSKTDS